MLQACSQDSTIEGAPPPSARPRVRACGPGRGRAARAARAVPVSGPCGPGRARGGARAGRVEATWTFMIHHLKDEDLIPEVTYDKQQRKNYAD